MHYRHIVLAFSVFCFAAVPLCWRPSVNCETAAAVAPYTAHLTITKNRVLPDGSSLITVSTEVRARDRKGRIYVKTERVFQDGDQRTEWFSFLVRDEAMLQELTWDSNHQVATLGHWPFWSGRKGCWADEQGQHQSSFPSEEDWHKVPSSPREGKLETIASFADPSGDKRIKARFVSENLGHKEIHGLNAFGMRWTMTPLESGGSSAISEYTTELWKSREFDLTLLKVTSGPKYGLTSVEISDLQRADPDPALFEPPQGYKFQTIEYHPVPCRQR
jgi:hypothetical protein